MNLIEKAECIIGLLETNELKRLNEDICDNLFSTDIRYIYQSIVTNEIAEDFLNDFKKTYV